MKKLILVFALLVSAGTIMATTNTQRSATSLREDWYDRNSFLWNQLSCLQFYGNNC